MSSRRTAALPRALRALVVASLLGALTFVVLPSSAPEGDAATTSAAGASSDYRVAIPGYRWAPCRTIGWKYNSEGQRTRMLPVLREAFRRVSNLTGLTFRYEGRTARSAARYSGSAVNTEILISWATPQRARGLDGTRVGLTRTYADPMTRRYRSAAVMFDRTATDVRPGFASSGPATWGQVAMHEIGHVIGLSHASGRGQLMNQVLGSNNHQLGAGDRTGFRRLGRQGACG